MTRLRLIVPALAALAALSPCLRAQCGPPLLQELAASDPQQGARLGSFAALDGDTLVAGAPTADLNVGGSNFRGAVYAWRRVAGAWTAEAKVPGPSSPYTYLGSGVDVSGDVLVAGGFSGAYPYERAWVYRRSGSAWTQEAELLAGDPLTAGSVYPHDVAVEGAWAAVGHYRNLGTPVTNLSTGAVYVYRFDGSAWNQESKLVPADAQHNDQVGWNVDLAGGVLVFNSRTNTASDQGRVHVYRLNGTTVTPEAVLTPPSPAQGLDFGYGLSTDGTRIAVSDIADTELAGNQGAVHIYRSQAGAWVLEQSVRPFLPAGVGGQFGQELAIDGEDLVVSGTLARLWHFKRVNGVWIELGQAAQPTTSGYDIGGLDLEGGVVAVGSPVSNLPLSVSGAVYVFDPSASQLVCTYCTAKVNSQGCASSIGWTGSPSAAAGSGFTISASQLLPKTNGLLFYGLTATQASPFQGGFLCMQAPLRRTPFQKSGGSTPCSGTFGFDFNAYIASGADPALVTGAVVRAQYWSRDPAASFGTNLTDALSFVLAP